MVFIRKSKNILKNMGNGASVLEGFDVLTF